MDTPDTVTFYRQQIQRILTEHAQIPYAHGDIRIQTIFDRESDHYLIMLVGWDKNRRIHGCLVHIDIVDGKIWIQRDGTEDGVGNELINAGIPRERIIAAFWQEEAEAALII